MILRITITSIFAFFLTGCVTNDSVSNQPDNTVDVIDSPLYRAFQTTIANNNPKKVSSFYSVSFYGEDDDTFDSMDSIRFLRSWVVTEESHFEISSTSDMKGCLAINGFDADKNPDTLTLTYIFENSRWVIDDVFVDTHEDESGFYTEAVCPTLND